MENKPDHSLNWVALTIGLYAAAAIAVRPVVDAAGPILTGLTPFFVAGMLTTELSTSMLLLIWFRQARTWSLLLLASAYLYSAAMVALHLLVFPDAIIAGKSILGSMQSGGWTFVLWIFGFAVLTLASTINEAWFSNRCVKHIHVHRVIMLAVAAVVLVAVSILIVTVNLPDRMPLLIRGDDFTPVNNAINLASMILIAASIAIILLMIGKRNDLFLWIAASLTAMLFADMVGLMGGRRYTVGWTLARLSLLTSACILFLFFIRRFVRQQFHLANARDRLEQAVAERTAALSAAVHQRDLLLREVYHRVKNNLQVVDSLIMMETRRMPDPTAFQELRNRIYTLALVHQQLMSSSNLETFPIEPFLHELAEHVMASFGPAATEIAVEVLADPLPVTLDFAIPVGLLATELLSNALRHTGATRVTVGFRQSSGGGAVLTVGDNSEYAEATTVRISERAGVGGRIIEGLTRQLGGQIAIDHNKGLLVAIHMPLPELV